MRLQPDPRRVIAKPFVPGGGGTSDGRSRLERMLGRILSMPESVVVATLSETYERFSTRHSDLTALLEENFGAAVAHVDPGALSVERRRLIGAYFTHEYSVDAAALSNPSMVPAPSQEGVATDALRFVLSLRGIGEGHVSSIQFRSGVIDKQGRIAIDDVTQLVTMPRRRTPTYSKLAFRTKLSELHASAEIVGRVLDPLPDQFSMELLDAACRAAEQASNGEASVHQTTRTIHWLASSNYESVFRADTRLSERVLFPAGPTESQGMEDARFVRFAQDDGNVTYFAPYTAFDGYEILPQLIETPDFISFRVATLNGPAVANKGIALFPRKVNGRFMALARLDNENNHLIRSDNVRFWYERETLQVPEAPWELTQIGNAGSPIETEAGWLVITHGVGPFRQYALGALLLDLRDPARVIGRLREPLLCPDADERDGYVPNVVYSCGSMTFAGLLVLPYGFSDVGARIATVRLEDLLSELSRH